MIAEFSDELGLCCILKDCQLVNGIRHVLKEHNAIGVTLNGVVSYKVHESY